MKICTFFKVTCLAAAVFFSYACSSGNGKAKTDGEDSSSKIADSSTATIKPGVIPTTGLEAEPGLQKADSLQILYFDNPDGDSLRYTRYYTFVSSGDKVTSNLILSNLDQPFRKSSAIKDCRSEGKIYLYAGENPVKTLYFSSRGDSCSYIYMISNGAFLYFDLKDSVRNTIKLMKKIARKP